MTTPDLRLDEVRALAVRDDLAEFVQRAVRLHPSDLADVTGAVVGAVAALAGAFIPILLERLRVDPAIASSVFVTTFTDVCGFLLLLGMGTLLLF